MSPASPLLIVIPTLNEIDNLPLLVKALGVHVPDGDILVVDDNSSDGTGAWCDAYQDNKIKLKVIHRNERGLGSATVAGLQWGLRHNYSFIATMDADFSHQPESLAKMFNSIQQKSNQNGVVIGSRYVEGGSIVGWPWHRRLGSSLVNGYVSFFLGLKTKDNSSAFRIYKAAALWKIDLNSIRSTGFAYLEEILWWLEHARVEMLEIPIEFRNRKRGDSKVRLKTLVGSGWDIWKLSIRNLLKKR